MSGIYFVQLDVGSSDMTVFIVVTADKSRPIMKGHPLITGMVTVSCCVSIFVYCYFSGTPVRLYHLLHSTPKNAPRFSCTGLLASKTKSRKHSALKVDPPWRKLLNLSRIEMEADKKLYLFVRQPQRRRLGNQMFVYASLFGVAWRNRRIPVWPGGRTHVQAIFNPLVPIDGKNHVIGSRDSRSVQLSERTTTTYINETEQLPKRNVTLLTWLQSWKYFAHVEDQLRIDFTFKDSVLRQARNFIATSRPATWKEHEFVRVVVHVRRTDYFKSRLVRSGWPAVSKGYLDRSRNLFVNCFPRVQFIVLSDDVKWCTKNIIGTTVVYSQRHSPYVDMAIASLCDHAIVTGGTFGWWVAWFANGITITPKSPLSGKRSMLSFNREDFYKPDWISL